MKKVEGRNRCIDEYLSVKLPAGPCVVGLVRSGVVSLHGTTIDQEEN